MMAYSFDLFGANYARPSPNGSWLYGELHLISEAVLLCLHPFFESMLSTIFDANGQRTACFYPGNIQLSPTQKPFFANKAPVVRDTCIYENILHSNFCNLIGPNVDQENIAPFFLSCMLISVLKDCGLSATILFNYIVVAPRKMACGKNVSYYNYKEREYG